MEKTVQELCEELGPLLATENEAIYRAETKNLYTIRPLAERLKMKQEAAKRLQDRAARMADAIQTLLRTGV